MWAASKTSQKTSEAIDGMEDFQWSLKHPTWWIEELTGHVSLPSSTSPRWDYIFSDTAKINTLFFSPLENLFWIWKSFRRLAFPQPIQFSRRTPQFNHRFTTSPPPSDLHDRSTWHCRWPCAANTTSPKRVPWDHRGLSRFENAG